MQEDLKIEVGQSIEVSLPEVQLPMQTLSPMLPDFVLCSYFQSWNEFLKISESQTEAKVLF